MTHREAAQRLQDCGRCPPGNFIVLFYSEPRVPLVFGKSPKVSHMALMRYDHQEGDRYFGIEFYRELVEYEFPYAIGLVDSPEVPEAHRAAFYAAMEGANESI